MKLVLLLVCLAAAVLADDTYNSGNDDFDVSQVLQNERLLVSYSKCLLNKGPCTPEVKKVKDKLPEALQTRCAKCTPRQKETAQTLARELKKTHPEIWEKLVQHYDPEGKYQESFKDWLN
ncbi:insect pheromone-binding family, a10/OS-D domain-containing protein [Phthorimaea operculella]|nr:insect pheromone-binding family, a10/OS-D domain-containing protein [Phthorimaea operculella]